MTRQWKTKTHDNLLVLTMLMFVKSVWALDGNESETSRKISNVPNVESGNELTVRDASPLEVEIGTSVDADTLEYYLNHWNESYVRDADSACENATEFVYYGDGLTNVLFRSSAVNDSLILSDLSRCSYDFGFVTCLKFLLLNRLDDALDYLSANNLTGADLSFANGIVTFDVVRNEGDRTDATADGEILDLDRDISRKMAELFRNRSLRVNLIPGLAIDVKPVSRETDTEFVSFETRPRLKWNFWRKDDDDSKQEESTARKKRKGFQMPSMMMMPQLIMLGFMPFVLANLQAMVMNAFMLNMMALNSAIFMTIRNLVFGPRGGPKIKYVNYGYRKKKKKSKVPTVIVHSPAAFVKQPFHKFRKRRPVHHQFRGPPAIHQIHHEEVVHFDEIPESHVVEFHGNGGYVQGGHHGGGAHDRHGQRDDLIRVTREKGRLDGENRLRISMRSRDANVKELLQRIRFVERNRERFRPPERDGFRDSFGEENAIAWGEETAEEDEVEEPIGKTGSEHGFVPNSGTGTHDISDSSQAEEYPDAPTYDRWNESEQTHRHGGRPPELGYDEDGFRPMIRQSNALARRHVTQRVY